MSIEIHPAEWLLAPAYERAVSGDYSLLRELQTVMTRPYDEQSREVEEAYYRLKPCRISTGVAFLITAARLDRACSTVANPCSGHRQPVRSGMSRNPTVQNVFDIQRAVERRRSAQRGGVRSNGWLGGRPA